ncbi:efflux RND transporter permease subunit [Paracerasibacillus soli]|uniref:Efflux RND transporter permease subunit n=1 Tax=Paracerasibacillus soli TaxID=480284 RepID=A0ABU5CUZ3_9BACI|nr:efflux RND transporter permease subunit [Virgibacillus soli]MDY0409647.1 efflux RND transporter permease subunit [Virgibacillus soli]
MIALTLVCSVVIAFTWIPALAENFLKVKVKKTKQNRGIIYRYGQLIAWITKKRRRSVGIITLFFAVFISSFLLVTKIPMTVMPDIFNRYAEVMIELEPGVAPEQRKEIALEVHEQLQNITDVAYDLVIDNDDMLITLINMTPEDEQTMEQVKVNEEIMRSLRQLEKDYPIVNVLSSTEGTFGLPVQLTISGESLAGLVEVSKQVTAELQNINGIRSVVSDANHFSEELLVQWNEVNLQKDHISKTDVQQQMTFLFQHVPVGSLVKDGLAKPINLKANQAITKQSTLLDYEINTAIGPKKLANYISLMPVTTPTTIERQDGERYVRVMADIEDRDLGAVNRDVQALLKNMEVEDGYTVSLAGELEAQQDAFIDLLVIFAVSLFLVFLVMAVQFNSIKHPIIILSVIPITITGVIVGLFITQKELNILSGIGVIMLIGIVLNNGILLIDRVKQLRAQGMHTNEAIVLAGKDRIRPIFMTTLTTVGGMIPLAFATGASSGYQSPLAVVIISGLLFSTCITLVLIPAIYLLFEHMESGLKKIFTRKKEKKELPQEDIA